MKFSMLRNLTFAFASLLAMASCSNDDAGYYYVDTTAHGIIGNASPNSGDLYFFADDNQVNANALNFGSAAGYYNFLTGDRTLTVRNAEGTVLATQQVTLNESDFFTAFAVNVPGSTELVVFEDQLTKPLNGKVQVRFINLSPDADAIDILDGTSSVNTAVAFKQATPFVELSAGNHNFVYKLTADASELYTQSVSLQPGRIYTIYTKGFVAPASGSNDAFSAETVFNY